MHEHPMLTEMRRREAARLMLEGRAVRYGDVRNAVGLGAGFAGVSGYGVGCPCPPQPGAGVGLSLDEVRRLKAELLQRARSYSAGIGCPCPPQPGAGAGVGWYGWFNMAGYPAAGVGAAYYQPAYVTPYPFQPVYPHNPHARASVQGVGWAGPMYSIDGAGVGEEVLYAIDPEGEYLVAAMKDPVGELYAVADKMGFGDKEAGFTEAVQALQLQFGLHPTGVVDQPMIAALDQWGSSYSIQLERALQVLGTDPERNGLVAALMQLQNRFDLPATGVLDAETARILRKQVYDPSDDELRGWLSRHRAETRPYQQAAEYVASGEAAREVAATAAEKVREALQPNFFIDYAARVGKDPLTYAGLAASVIARVFVPALGWVSVLPLAGVLVYELSDEAAKLKR